MARKILNRKELRAAGEAAEAAEAADEVEDADEGDGDDGEEGGAKKKAKKAAPKRATARKSRAKTAKEVRRKAFWGIFNQTGKRVHLFEYSERKQADKKAGELTASQKTPHYVAIVKDEIV
ncbi:MAG TPA: hypothetical protein VHX65_07325 [Pirellulales bacterium]|jgi:hypothetical protein|nr:hypothetical protein [Pirellulales bacterium]